MRITKQAAWPLLAVLLFAAATSFLFASTCIAQDPAEPKKEDPEKKVEPKGNGAKPDPEKKKGEEGNGNGAAKIEAPVLPGFVYVPPGTVHPGGTWDNFKERHQGGEKLKQALIYDVWGRVKADDLKLPGFYIGRYEVTNAQWKLYLDRNFRVEHVCTGQDTLWSLTERYIKFRNRVLEQEWKAIYALNAKAVMDAIKKRDAARRQKDPDAKPDWDPKWTRINPNPAHSARLSRVFLPKGLKLTFYKHRLPRPWYGWCKLSNLRIGREYVDAAKVPAQAFEVPKNKFFASLKKLRADDFAAHPVRDLSPHEILTFCEWAGLQLPSEYEFERVLKQSRPNTDQHPFPGKWDHRAQKRFFCWTDNPIGRFGPVAVDDPSVAKGDSHAARKGVAGARHMLGNVWELTRTFYDLHPLVTPRPPEDPTFSGMFNFALTAKGGSHGDGWQVIQASTRAGAFTAKGWFDLTENNRADTLGFRLVRHAKPGWDLMSHSVLNLTYNRVRGKWATFTPQHFNRHHMGGVDLVHITEAKSPYVYIQEQGAAVALAPLWISKLDAKKLRSQRKAWRDGKASGRDYIVVGALRTDVPLKVGKRLSPQDAAELDAERKKWEAANKLFQEWNKKYGKKKKRKTTPEQPPDPGPKPADPDKYELETKRNRKNVGLWRGATLEPGEWLVVFWYGHIGLVNKALSMPPSAIILLDKKDKQAFERQRSPTQDSKVELDAEKNLVRFELSTEEQANPKKPDNPPGVGNSEFWAWSEVHPTGWKRRNKPSKFSWFVRFTVETAAPDMIKKNRNK